MSKLLSFDHDVLKALLKGAKTLSKAVIVTLGPKGRNVIIRQEHGLPLSTKDGVTVAKAISLKDPFEDMGAQLIKEASSKTNDVAGDGTTTAIVLAEAILSEGIRVVSAGANPMLVKKGIERAVDAILEELDRLAKPVTSNEEILQIATISANNDAEIGEMIAAAMKKVGKDGTISTAEAKGRETIVDVVEGMKFDKGYLSPYFVTNGEKMAAELSNPLIFLTDKKLSSAKDIVPILEKLVESGSKPLLIIADEIEGEALATLAINKLKGGLSLCAAKAPGFGDRRKALLQDIAILTGATVLSEEVGLKLEDLDSHHFGSAKEVKVTKDDTTIIEGKGSSEAIKARIAQLRHEIANATSDYDREKLEERLGKLGGGVAVIHVGASTESELKEKKMRIEDALSATRAAALEGVVAGGGVALIRASYSLDRLVATGDEKIGISIIQNCISAPAIAIATNCGKQGHVIAQNIAQGEGSYGYNGLTDEFGDMMAFGVIDPVLVTKSALKNAASISALLITAAAMVVDKPEPKKKEAAGPGFDPSMGMGGMM